jgi:hypothetical protein
MDKLSLKPNDKVVNTNTDVSGLVLASYERGDICYVDVRTNFCVHWESPVSKWRLAEN